MSNFTSTRAFGVRGFAPILASSLALLLVLTSAANVATAQDEQTSETAAEDLIEFVDKPLPKFEEMELPSIEDLLHKRPVDWIVLRRGDVLIVEPISLRPDALGVLQKELEAAAKWPRPRDDAEEKLQQLKRLRLQYLDIVLAVGGDDEVYQLNVPKWVKEIIYHEDLMLRRIDALLDEGNLRQAFELLYVLERRHPGWPGLDQRQNRLIFDEAKLQLDAGKLEIGFGTLEQLHGRRRGYPGLYQSLGRTADTLINAAAQTGDFRKARFFMSRLAKLEPEHPTVATWNENLTSRAKRLIDDANQASRDGEHAKATQLAVQATEVWPTTPGLRETFRRTNERFQSLRVGVVGLALAKPLEFLETDADYRHRCLAEMRMFDVDNFDEIAHHESRYFEAWEPTDLARQMDFVLRPSRAYWESQQVVTSPPIVRTLAARIDSESPLFDERLASYVSGLTTRGPFQFRVTFSRVPVRAESLLNLPIQAEGVTDEEAVSPLSQRFVVHERDERRVVYRRSVEEPDTARQFHVAEVVEQKYDTPDHAIQALLRGEVSMLPQIRGRDVAAMRADDRFFVIKNDVPVTHVLQFNPLSVPLANHQLRRALAYAIDRQRILQETVLQSDSSELGRVVSAPFPSRSYAYNSLVPPRDYNFPLAMALSVAAKKKLTAEQQVKDMPPLRMLCHRNADVLAAAKKLVEAWATVGITVEIVEYSPEELDGTTIDALPQWDILYRTVRMLTPVYDLWPFLTMERAARVTSLTHLPGWLRQQIIELDAVTDMESATKMLHSLHISMQSEVCTIPLWELEQFQVLRRTISNFSQSPTHPYQEIERWIIAPWYNTEQL